MTLETFIDNGVRRLAQRNYVPREFLARRERLGLAPAIACFVDGSDFKGGFLRVLQLGLVDWSLEAAVARFPGEFSIFTLSYARARLKGICGPDGKCVIEPGKFALPNPPISDPENIAESVRRCHGYAFELMRRAGLVETGDEERAVLCEMALFWHDTAAEMLGQTRVPASAAHS